MSHGRRETSAGHGWPSVPVAHENTVFARITLLADTVFARISLLAGWREGTVSHGRRKTSLFSALLDESGLKPSLATTHAEASLLVSATLLVFKDKKCRGDMRYAARKGFDWSS
ncbi:hypothetical protein [Desulfosporosinus nitroreducens]|uniref:Uncharacterized protein n=1 Tax=Desulfosporosinus nitroreducens TaxID=2018668 RepID=A0ABT8QXT5_9FIRM|nr:hypothetical protein [Desulfosporosinus nitroreducens]MDO0824883.1 hypothetical protein [Desulfosporosinus nitroreducens]